ncbi:MAG: phosphoenolpyruvate--protein phosphotransferase [Myxococcales bacterium]|nr:phosphoenolpyruvate--protein phosphotransferase [Myxococcales bacterium]
MSEPADPDPTPTSGDVASPRRGLPAEHLPGLQASPGVAIGPAVVVGSAGVTFPRRNLRAAEIEAEWRRFELAVESVQDELRAVTKRMPGTARGAPGSPGASGTRTAEASILEAYVLMVGDDVLARAVRDEIELRRRGAEWAVDSAIQRLAGELATAEDAYLRERSHDVVFVGERLLRALVGAAPAHREIVVSQPSIVVARDLSPADTAAMCRQPVLGFVTEVGSRTSHTAIMARALGIPAVVGVVGALERVQSGDLLVLDGLRGRHVVHPSSADLADARARSASFEQLSRELDAHRAEPALTRDGTPIGLYANIELPAEAPVAREHGARGVGLYRTEFLYIDRAEPPTEDEQLAVFHDVLGAMPGLPVTLRTFDIGGDKFVTAVKVPHELNPMMGLRAVRLGLARPELLLTQLRAMVRASAFGEVRIMVPMVASLDELRQVRTLLERATAEVRAAGHSHAGHIPLGVMIEVPSAALLADAFAREADFLSLGTNDLVQYTLAVDRSNRVLAHLASPFHPAVLRLVVEVLRAAERHHRPVSSCGEMASDPLGAALLLGLGLRDFSMDAVALAEIKVALGRVSCEEASDVARRALELPTAAEVERLVYDAFAARYHDLLLGEPGASVSSARRRHGPPASRSGRGGPPSSQSGQGEGG